jgi:hypothetical protein
MISHRSKWLVGGFVVGLVALAIWQVLAFSLLHELQAAASPGQMLPPELLQRSMIVKFTPALMAVFYVGCLCSVLALISLILDNRSRR